MKRSTKGVHTQETNAIQLKSKECYPRNLVTFSIYACTIFYYD